MFYITSVYLSVPGGVKKTIDSSECRNCCDVIKLIIHIQMLLQKLKENSVSYDSQYDIQFYTCEVFLPIYSVATNYI